MAKPFEDGRGWAFRLRIRGQDIYRSGFASEAEARRVQAEIRVGVEKEGKATGIGPFKTTLAAAFMNYARERLPYLKAARQDAQRINRYLRPFGLPIIVLTEIEHVDEPVSVYWDVSFIHESERSIPNSLTLHRAEQERASSRSAQQRARLAGMKMADVTTHDLQLLISAMVSEGKKPATVDLERAELRRLFNHARKVWRWSKPGFNPATDIDAPPIDNARNRVLTNDEWLKISKSLSEYGNPYVVPVVCLMLETAMRSCEPLTHLRWEHVNWSRRVLELPDSKCGKRDVPLNPAAVVILGELAARSGDFAPSDRVFPTTYEAVKKAWSVCREESDVHGVMLHDLRHTSATRYSLEYKGNLPVIMMITGHKTVEMAMRYINLKADDVVRMMHGDAEELGSLPAGYKMNLADAFLPDDVDDEAPTEVAVQQQDADEIPSIELLSSLPRNVVRIDFGRRAA